MQFESSPEELMAIQEQSATITETPQKTRSLSKILSPDLSLSSIENKDGPDTNWVP